MSFIYPRQVYVSRPNTSTPGIGAQPYQEFTPSDEAPMTPALPASIQADRYGSRPLANVPGDTVSRGMWKIFIPQGAALQAGIGSPGSIVADRDFVVDDQGLRYQVTQAYWNSLGPQLRCERLSA